MAHSWIVYGSGPSAARWPIPKHADGTPFRVATCNSSRTLCRYSDLFGVYEYNAGVKLKPSAPTPNCISPAGFPQVIAVRPFVASVCDLSGKHGIMVVDHQFGPPELRHLHQDVVWGEPVVPDYGQRRAWISAGVLNLWIVAEVYRPLLIVVAGLDGYPLIKGSAPDYSKGLTDLSAKGMDADPVEAATRRRNMNERMGLGIEQITRYYTDRGVRFVWLQRPHHYSPSWQVSLADDQTLHEVYPGVQDANTD